ncbi:hypothetical protein ACIHEJ_28165 [Streptomyces sp. NPDC052301]|uniref:hypothetical protein n=1 Tax=Streptomyces sp. NPDC052301 TaxID=3365687 RepID=UPI0037D29552
MNNRSLALGCACVVAALLLGPTATAHAATAPHLNGVGSDGAPAGGLVSVYAGSDSAITSITAHLYAPDSAADAPEVAEVSDFTRVSGTDTQGVWRTSTPLRLSALGTYRVVVDLKDADGDTASLQGANGYDYWLQAHLSDFQVTPQNPDFEHQNVSVSGRYTVEDPRTGTTGPAGGQVMLSTSNWNDSPKVPLDADGRFSYSYHQTDAYGPQVSPWLYPDTTDPVAPDSTSVDVVPVQSDTRVTLDASELQVKDGQPAAVSGKAEYYLDGQWKPLPGVTVTELYASDTGAAAARPVTDADGRFTGQLTLPHSGTVEVQIYSGTYLKNSPEQTLKLYVAKKTSITGFTATLDKYSQLTAKGLLNTGKSMPADLYYKVGLQYSADGRTGWKTMKTVTPGNYEPGTGATFKGTFATAYKGYYRAHFAGDGRNWQESYSPVVHVQRTPTRITGGNASPEPVRKGHTLTYKGKLQYSSSGTWKAYAGQTVKILFRPKGASTWYDMGNTTTRTDGTFSKAATASKDGTWVAVLLYPNSTHLTSAGYEDYVDVV